MTSYNQSPRQHIEAKAGASSWLCLSTLDRHVLDQQVCVCVWATLWSVGCYVAGVAKV